MCCLGGTVLLRDHDVWFPRHTRKVIQECFHIYIRGKVFLNYTSFELRVLAFLGKTPTYTASPFLCKNTSINFPLHRCTIGRICSASNFCLSSLKAKKLFYFTLCKLVNEVYLGTPLISQQQTYLGFKKANCILSRRSSNSR